MSRPHDKKYPNDDDGKASLAERQRQRELSSSSLSSSSSTSKKCLPPPFQIPTSAWPYHPRPVLIAHRGASGQLPEHTLAGYRLALDMGADYIEPDLVPTKDGQLIAMHSVDLNITTNVAEVFPDRLLPSLYQNNQTGYWAYSFTLQEIQQLKVRQRLPHARSTIYDGMFGIPTLTEIIQLLFEWQTTVLPAIHESINTTQQQQQQQQQQHRRAGPGLYAELKSKAWILQDTGMDLLQLLWDHIEIHSQIWKDTIFQRLCHLKALKEQYEYDLPPFVIQSFDATILHQFHTSWEDQMMNIYGNTTDVPIHVIPPTVLLLSHQECHEESLWFTLGDNYRSSIQGLGPDKQCLLDMGRSFMERAKKYDMVVHPYTIRPELEYVMTTTSTSTTTMSMAAQAIRTPLEELLYLFCDMNVDGIFTESIPLTMQVAAMDCATAWEPLLVQQQQQGGGGAQFSSSLSNNNNNPNNISFTTTNKNNHDTMTITVGFVLGAILIVSIVTILARSQNGSCRPSGWGLGFGANHHRKNRHAMLDTSIVEDDDNHDDSNDNDIDPDLQNVMVKHTDMVDNDDHDHDDENPINLQPTTTTTMREVL